MTAYAVGKGVTHKMVFTIRTSFDVRRSPSCENAICVVGSQLRYSD
jgi:hypothetical protein